MSVSIAPNDSALLYSPYNWLPNGSTNAQTVNPGAYLRTIFTGTSCVFKFDTSPNTATFPDVAVRIDGRAWTRYTLAATVSVASGLTNRPHLLEMVFESANENQGIWTSPAATMVFTGLTLDAAASVRLPDARKYNCIVYGDSITEGVRTIADTGPGGTVADNSAVGAWPLALAQLLDCEVGVVGFGGSGVVTAGSGGVPALTASYALLWSGHTRTFSPAPDLVVFLEGENDAGAGGVSTGLVTVMTAIQGIAANAKFLVCRPFSGTSATQVLAAVTAMASARVVYVDTTGWISAGTDTSDGTHPYDFVDLAVVAPRIAAAALPILLGAPVAFPFS